MGTIGVGVGHEDDLAITGLVEVEGLARPGTNDLDDRGALGVLEHGTEISLLHIENLAAYRKQSLVLGVTSHVGRSEAESPSTMNSSVTSGSEDRQSLSLGGR